MAETFPNPNDVANQAVDGATDMANQVVDDLAGQIPDVPDPSDIIPDIPPIPDIGGLIGSIPLPSFRKPEKIKVEKPPLPRKLQKQSKIPKVPKS